MYGADGWAVRELLKVAAMLRAALDAPAADDHHHDSSPLSYDFTTRVTVTPPLSHLIVSYSYSFYVSRTLDTVDE